MHASRESWFTSSHHALPAHREDRGPQGRDARADRSAPRSTSSPRAATRRPASRRSPRRAGRRHRARVYRHFPSKAELFTEVVPPRRRRASSRVVETVTSGRRPPAARADGRGGRGVRPPRARRAHPRLRAASPSPWTPRSRPSGSPSGAATATSSRARSSDGIAAGELAPHDAETVAAALVGRARRGARRARCRASAPATSHGRARDQRRSSELQPERTCRPAPTPVRVTMEDP